MSHPSRGGRNMFSRAGPQTTNTNAYTQIPTTIVMVSPNHSYSQRYQEQTYSTHRDPSPAGGGHISDLDEDEHQIIRSGTRPPSQASNRSKASQDRQLVPVPHQGKPRHPFAAPAPPQQPVAQDARHPRNVSRTNPNLQVPKHTSTPSRAVQSQDQEFQEDFTNGADDADIGHYKTMQEPMDRNFHTSGRALFKPQHPKTFKTPMVDPARNGQNNDQSQASRGHNKVPLQLEYDRLPDGETPRLSADTPQGRQPSGSHPSAPWKKGRQGQPQPGKASNLEVVKFGDDDDGNEVTFNLTPHASTRASQVKSNKITFDMPFTSPGALLSSIDQRSLWQERLKIANNSPMPTWDDVYALGKEQRARTGDARVQYDLLKNDLSNLIQTKNLELDRARAKTQRYGESGSHLSKGCAMLEEATHDTKRRRIGWKA